MRGSGSRPGAESTLRPYGAEHPVKVVSPRTDSPIRDAQHRAPEASEHVFEYQTAGRRRGRRARRVASRVAGRLPRVEALEARRLLSLAVPALNSRPGAAAKLYLDFDGDVAGYWGLTPLPATPAYDRDGDVANFTDGELASITEIWARVAEKYSPVQHRRHDRRPRLARQLAGAPRGHRRQRHRGPAAAHTAGIAKVGSFSNCQLQHRPTSSRTTSPTAGPYWTAEIAAHEAGARLRPQAPEQPTPARRRTAEYNPGDAPDAPIMGNSSARRAASGGTARRPARPRIPGRSRGPLRHQQRLRLPRRRPRRHHRGRDRPRRLRQHRQRRRRDRR